MNKLTKVGLSALCGSLASVAGAHAGSLDVTGSAKMTHTNVSNGVVGNPIGMATGLTFTGNGELDGGQTFKLTLTDANKAAWSTASISLTTNSMGTFVLNSGGGGAGIGGYDDNMPRAYEEVWDTAIGTNVNLQKGVSGSTNVEWTSPSVLGTTLQIAYAPDNDGQQNNNKSFSGSASDHFGSGFDVVLDMDVQGHVAGFNLILGASESEVAKGTPGGAKAVTHDHEEGLVGLVLNLGPVEVGGQVSAERIATQTRNAANYYGNLSWGIAFNVNDDLSLSYSEHKSVQSKVKKASGPGMDVDGSERGNKNEYTPKSWMKGDSLQVAYTIGGVAIKYAQSKYDNTAYGFDTKAPKESQLVEVSMAF